MEEEAHEFFHTADHFAVDDLLVDFSNDDDDENDVIADSDGANTTTTAVADSSNSSFSAGGLPNFHGDSSFSGDLCVPVCLINFTYNCIIRGKEKKKRFFFLWLWKFRKEN